MTSKTWGYILLGGAAVWCYIKHKINQILIQFNKLKVTSITSERIYFTATILIKNPFAVDLKLNRLYGYIYVMGNYVGFLDTPLNQVIHGNSTSAIYIKFDASFAQLGQSLYDNIMTGDIRTLTVDFDGAAKVNSIAVPIQTTLTYSDLFE